ncbi:MAG: RagB/SusD family nutrient uptake outer membrane protein [Muribaculaceae bacterium]|nr:RagB/SusD family nutrient uptake outer membrane protein [Muribaculaceae bacterium]
MKKFSSHIKVLLAFMALCFGTQLAYAYGADVNGDGYVTSADVTAIYDVLLGEDNVLYIYTADVNGDGAVTAADITEVYDVLLGIKPAITDDDLFEMCYATLHSEQQIHGTNYYSTDFLWNMWSMNELSSDNAIKCSIFDTELEELSFNYWGSDNIVSEGLYLRLCNSIDMCNDYLSRASQHDAQHNAEVQFIRTLYYYYLLDLYGRVPTNIDATIPTRLAKQQKRSDVMSFVFTNFAIVANNLAEPKTVEYGRVDKAAAWLLAARVLLNSEIYSPSTSYDMIIERLNIARQLAQAVIASPYKLNTSGKNGNSAYQLLFMGDNGSNGAQQEIIFPIKYNSSSDYWAYGGTTRMIQFTSHHNYQSIWPTGLDRTDDAIVARKALVNKFNVPSSVAALTPPNTVAAQMGDDRALFLFSKTNPEISSPYFPGDGWDYCKWSNRPSNNSTVNQSTANTDFPLLRVAEAYLILAEVDAKLNTTESNAEGLEALNTVRARSGAAPFSELTLSNVYDEWAREFAFEGLRRTILVRRNFFGVIGSVYGPTIWDWKAGINEGREFDPTKNVFAIPASVLAQNSQMTQNPGYDIDFGTLDVTADKTEYIHDGGEDQYIHLSWPGITSSEYIIYPTYEVQVSVDGTFINRCGIYPHEVHPGDYFVTDSSGEDNEVNVWCDDLDEIADVAEDELQMPINKLYLRIVGNMSGCGKAVSDIIEVHILNK